MNPNKPITWFEYSNEEEYEKVLLQLSEVIIKYGFEFLKQMSIEEIIPTNEYDIRNGPECFRQRLL